MDIDRKWGMLEPSMRPVGEEPPPPYDSIWTNNNFINLARLLRSPRYHVVNPSIPPAEAWYIISCIDTHLEQEIAFAQQARATGAKVVVALSTDARFHVGHGLYCHSTGTLYTELCKHADAITSGMPDHLHLYGDHQSKVVPLGEFVERLNFSTIPFQDRSIDLLGTGHITECSLSFYLVLFLMIKEKYPDKRVVYAFRDQPEYDPMLEQMSVKYPQIEFVKDSMANLLPETKLYINLEERPRPGRASVEAWYYRVPSISSANTYFAKLFPDFTYNNMSFDSLLDIYTMSLESDYDTVISNAERTIEYDYAENAYARMINMMDGGKV
jgi:hypothetical protein